MAKSKKEEGPGWFSGQTAEIDGRKCLNGVGPVPAKIMFVAKGPNSLEVSSGRAYTSGDLERFKKKLRAAGFPMNQARLTYATHHIPKKKSADEVNWGRRMFEEELEAVRPYLVVCLGADALKAVVGTSYRWDDVHGCWFRPDSVPDCQFEVFATFTPEQVYRAPKWQVYQDRDIERITNRMLGSDVTAPECKNAVIHTPEKLAAFTKWFLSRPGKKAVALDCEWNGKNWMDPDRYFRTVQIGFGKGKVVTLEVSAEGGKRMYDGDERDLFAELKKLLEDPSVGIVGHNVIADGEWLLSYGVDIRNNVKWDTMLAEHLIDQNGPFGLEALSMKYTNYGRYSSDVEVWVRRHQNPDLPDTSAMGYGWVPREKLLEYGKYDVDCLWYILDEQMKVLKERGVFKRRGVDGEYPSLFNTVMDVQRVTYDLEMNGLPVDTDQLDMLTEKYQDAKAEALSKVMAMARAVGFEDFNPRSVQHLRKMLFGNLGLTPVKTTDGSDWGEVVGEIGMDSEDEPAAATDKTTLQILEGSHPFVDALLDFRRLDQVCKTWLTKEKDGKPAGLYADIWPDGTLKSRFSTLTETGRYRTQRPNCFPGEVEVLTDRGWMRWDYVYAHGASAERDGEQIMLAQWDMDTMEISFATPLRYVMKPDEECVHVFSEQQIDIVCTPDHRFTVYDRKNRSRRKTVTASDLPGCEDWLIPQAGRLVKGGLSLTEDQVAVACALQADGHLVKCGGIDWRFDKARKLKRLKAALEGAGIPYHEYERDNGGRTRFGVYVGKSAVPYWLWGMKKFGEWLMDYDSDTIARFEKEVWLWDGCASRRSMFASALRENSDWVQMLCLFNGRRGKIRRYVSNTGSESWQVDASDRCSSQLANLSCESAGRHTVYCASMPKDTVIVRYNGKVSFTNQCQNFPKKAEGYLSKIFGEGNEPPLLRTIVDPNKRARWRDAGIKVVQLEGDWKQAELFTMANLSQDQNMIKALTTPGLDLHDKTAVDSFGLHMFDENGHEVSEDDLIRMASELKDAGGADSEEFQHFMKTLTYVDQHGSRISRSEFKSGIRVSAKSINFGIPYGRSARPIALQIKAETGDRRSLEEIASEVSKVLESWKTKAFPTCWATLQGWASLLDSQGWVENPWGLRKTGHKTGRDRDDAPLRRQFQNFPIQSTVSSTMHIAMGMMRRYILDNDLPFVLQNQIHDAVMVECPVDMIEECKDMFRKTMAGIRIPLKGGKWFTLDVDIDVYERWGVKMK